MDLTCLDESPTIYKLPNFMTMKILYSFIQKQKTEANFPHTSTWNKGINNFNTLFKHKEEIHDSYFLVNIDTWESVRCSQACVVIENVIKGRIAFHNVILIRTNLRYKAYFIDGTHLVVYLILINS